MMLASRLTGSLLALGIAALAGAVDPAQASGPGTVKFDENSLSVIEGAGVALVVVERSHGEDGAITASYASADVSASAGSDYQAVAGTLSWADGDGSDRVITVPILDDSTEEGGESFVLALSNVTGGGALDPSRSSVSLLILASDGGSGGGGCEPGDDCGGGGGDCEPGDDCGGGGGGGDCEPGDDCGGGGGGGDCEPGDDCGGGGGGGGDTGDGSGVIKFDENTFLGLESGGVAVITVERSHGEDGTASIDYTTSDGTASAGSDYTAVSGTISWGPGDGATRSFTVPLANDGAPEGNETVHLTLSNPTGGVVIDGERGTAVLVITESAGTPPTGGNGDRAGTFKFGERSYQVIEGQPFALVSVERSRGESGAVSVHYSATSGSASAGDDFEAVSGTLSWAANDGSTRIIQVPVVDDVLAEGTETVLLDLSGATGGAAIDSERGSALLNLLDDDGSLAACVPSPTNLCLLGGRFSAQITYRTPNAGTGSGHAVAYSNQTGLFWFFNQENAEMLLKVVDGCGVPGLQAHWVFFSATTNVDFTLTVTDTRTGISKQYRNPLGLAAEPIQDVSTFRACPQ